MISVITDSRSWISKLQPAGKSGLLLTFTNEVLQEQRDYLGLLCATMVELNSHCRDKALNISCVHLYRMFLKPSPKVWWGLNNEKSMRSGKRRNITGSQGR